MTPVERAGRILARTTRESDCMTVDQAAQAAHHAGGPSVAELAQRIAARRNRAA